MDELEPKITKEIAEEEVNRFCESMELDIDESVLDQDEIKSLNDQKRILVLSQMKGRLVFNDDGLPVFTPKDWEGKPLTFHEPRGATLKETDAVKSGKDVAKMHKIMGSMTKVGPAVFSNMHQRDLKVCTTLLTLFLG